MDEPISFLVRRCFIVQAHIQSPDERWPCSRAHIRLMDIPQMTGDWTVRLSFYIPRSRQYPKILWIDDAEVVGDGITKASPVLGDFVAQEIERDVRELSACGVAFVVRYIPVHETP